MQRYVVERAIPLVLVLLVLAVIVPVPVQSAGGPRPVLRGNLGTGVSRKPLVDPTRAALPGELWRSG